MANPVAQTIPPNFALLPPEALEEFKTIFKEELGVDLPDEIATQKATTILNLFKVLSKRPVAQKRGKK